MRLLHGIPLLAQTNIDRPLLWLSRSESLKIMLTNHAVEIGAALDVGKLLELVDMQLIKQIDATVVFQSPELVGRRTLIQLHPHVECLDWLRRFLRANLIPGITAIRL